MQIARIFFKSPRDKTVFAWGDNLAGCRHTTARALLAFLLETMFSALTIWQFGLPQADNWQLSC